MKRVEIDKDLLTNLYLIENLSKKKIAKILNVSLKVVCNRVKEYNLIKSRSEALKSGWKSLTDEEHKARCESISKGNIEYYKNNPDQSKRNENIQKSHLEYSEDKKNEIKSKYKNTMLETYGVEHNWQLEKNKDIILLSRGLNWSEYIDKYGIEDFDEQLSRLEITENPQLDIQRKTTETKHVNNSFTGSVGEELLYSWLCNILENVQIDTILCNEEGILDFGTVFTQILIDEGFKDSEILQIKLWFKGILTENELKYMLDYDVSCGFENEDELLFNVQRWAVSLEYSDDINMGCNASCEN